MLDEITVAEFAEWLAYDNIQAADAKRPQTQEDLTEQLESAEMPIDPGFME